MLVIFKTIFIFGLGMILGSFSNVLVDRTQKKKSLLGRSKCDKCGYQLSWFDNLPVLSFLWLKGRCRKCQKKINWQYPLVELFFGLIFLTVGWQSNLITGWLLDWREILEVSFLLLTSFVLGVIFIWDLKYMIIPDGLVGGGIIIGVVYYGYLYGTGNVTLLNVNNQLFSGLIGGGIVSGFFYLLYQFSHGRWIGGGDVKLGFWLGFLVGWKLIYGLLLLAYVSGSVGAIILLIGGKKKLQSKIPFGPFLVASAWVMLLWGDKWMKLIERFF